MLFSSPPFLFFQGAQIKKVEQKKNDNNSLKENSNKENSNIEIKEDSVPTNSTQNQSGIFDVLFSFFKSLTNGISVSLTAFFNLFIK